MVSFYNKLILVKKINLSQLLVCPKSSITSNCKKKIGIFHNFSKNEMISKLH